MISRPAMAGNFDSTKVFSPPSCVLIWTSLGCSITSPVHVLEGEGVRLRLQAAGARRAVGRRAVRDRAGGEVLRLAVRVDGSEGDHVARALLALADAVRFEQGGEVLVVVAVRDNRQVDDDRIRLAPGDEVAIDPHRLVADLDRGRVEGVRVVRELRDVDAGREGLRRDDLDPEAKY